MTIRTINISTIDQTGARTPAVAGERSPTLLTETELDQVAAAGGKGGASGGDVRCRHPVRPQ